MDDPAQFDDQVLHQVLEESHHRGFLGPGAILPHLQSAAQFAQALPSSVAQGCIKGEFSLLDMGSGGGLPGLPLLRWFPCLRGTLVDARSKRTRFLKEAVESLHLAGRTQVVTGRIEEMSNELGATHDVVTARSFGPPSATVELASHLLNPGGLVLVSEPPGGRLWAAYGLGQLGLEQVSADGAPIARFVRVGKPGVVRRWKHVVDRPAVVVTLRSF